MPAYSAMSAMTRSTMPQRTKFVYTRFPISVTHQPVPANARSALKTSKPATTNIMTAAKVSIPGLRATAPSERSVGSLTPPGIGSLCCVTLVEHLADLLEVPARHAPVQVADEGAGPRPYQPTDQDRGRKDQADRQASPATVLGRLLCLVYDLDIAFFVLGENCGVIGSHDVLAVQFFERLEVGLRIVDTLVVAYVHEHRVVTHFALPSASFATLVAFLVSLPVPDQLASTSAGNFAFSCTAVAHVWQSTLVAGRFSSPTGAFPL
jgi:hypothetical protein